MSTGPIVGVGELLWDLLPDGRRVPGGAPFNFAFHCNQLGREAIIVSRVGTDELGDELRAAVRGVGMTDEFIQVDPAYPTGTVHVTLTDGVPSYSITEGVAWDHLAWTLDLEALLRGAAAVGCGTLARRAGSRAAVDAAVRACPGLRFVDVNLRQHYHTPGVLVEALGLATVAKLTADEMLVVGLPNATAGELLTRFAQLDGVAVTDGPNGAEWHGRGGEAVRVPGVKVEVVDTVGAGDAFSAALVCGLLSGRPAADVLREANRYAAEVCRHAGGTPAGVGLAAGRAGRVERGPSPGGTNA